MNPPPFPAVMTEELIPGYRLMGCLGKGGYGEVWEATGPGGFRVALKFISLGGPIGEREMRALEVFRDIRHAHLLAMFGAWEVKGTLIVAMELADQTLLDRSREFTARGEPGIPGPELWESMREAGKGIDFLNEPRHRGVGNELVSIQHRDIKPQNLLLVGGSVKVADFGLARVLEDTLTGHSGGLTPAYAAPEFFEGRTAPQSDQYSLAVTYCQLRGGRLPFKGGAAELLAGHLHRSPDLSMLPPEERPVVARALAKCPSQRWASCLAFVQALTAGADRVPPSPGAPGGTARTGRHNEASSATATEAGRPQGRRHHPTGSNLPGLLAVCVIGFIFVLLPITCFLAVAVPGWGS